MPAAPEKTFEHVFELVIPVRADVRTRDGKLDGMLDADLYSYVPRDFQEGAVSLHTGVFPRELLRNRGAHLPLRTTAEIELFSVALTVDRTGARGALALDDYDA